MKKKYLILVCFIVFITVLFGGLAIFNNFNTKRKITPYYTDKLMERSELKRKIETFSIEFEYVSKKVEYNFIEKTKVISNSNLNSSKTYVAYNRFDELFDFLYDNFFQNKEDLTWGNNENTYGKVYADPQAVYYLTVQFNTDEIVPAYSFDKFGGKWWYNDKTEKPAWYLQGYKFPSYWDEFINILEIDESIFDGDKKFDLHDSKLYK